MVEAHARSGQGPGRHDPGAEAARCTSATTSSAASSPAACARCSTSAARPVKEAGPVDPGADPRLRGRARRRATRSLVVADAVEAREIAQKRQRLEREAQNRRTARGGTLEDFSRRAQGRRRSPRCAIIIKADQGGPAEALADALAQLSHQRSAGGGRPPRRRRHHRERRPARQGVGRDHPRLPRAARRQRPRRGRARSRSTSAPTASSTRRWTTCAPRSKACSSPEEKEIVLGEAEVLQVFKVSKVGTIAGCMVRSGIIQRTGQGRAWSATASQVYDGDISQPQAVQGRREGSARRARVRHRHRELQRPQGRRP